MSVVYIAGKIAGDPDYKQKFGAAAETLEAMGLIVLNPAILPEGMNPEDYMRICLAMVESAHSVIFLPGWELSAGAQVERMWARYARRPCFEFRDFVATFGGNRQKDTV